MRHCRIAVFLLTALFGAAACDPGVSRPGAWLSGEEVSTPVTDWTFTNAFEDCYLETATWYGMPHSVTLWCAVHDGNLHVGSFSAGGGWEGHRTWENHVARDGEGAARIDGRIYRGTWERVEDPSVIEAVERSYAAKYGHTETWKQGLATYDPLPEWRFYRLSQEAEPPKVPASPTVTFQGREVPRSEEAILDPDAHGSGGARDVERLRLEGWRRRPGGPSATPWMPEVERIARLLAAARGEERPGGLCPMDPGRLRRHGRRCVLRPGDARVQRPAYRGPAEPTRHPTSKGPGAGRPPRPSGPRPATGVLPKWRQDAFFSTPLDALMRWERHQDHGDRRARRGSRHHAHGADGRGDGLLPGGL